MITTRTIYQVDAFTDTPFKGNPAGVMIIDDTVTEEWMQNMAAEMNLSETAFIIQRGQYFDIRFFTPSSEVPLCGHATLASAHILFQYGYCLKSDTIYFKASGGDLAVSWENGWIKMNFPVYPLSRISVPAGFKEMVGFEPREAWSTSYQWVIAVADNAADIIQAKPAFDLMMKKGLGHTMITAKGEPGKEEDFVVRCFAPVSGISEDPVTGSAHCALTPLWSAKLGKEELNSLQLSKRSGRLKVKLLDDRVEIKGKAITVFEAFLKI